jgi:hypothetical protein
MIGELIFIIIIEYEINNSLLQNQKEDRTGLKHPAPDATRRPVFFSNSTYGHESTQPKQYVRLARGSCSQRVVG